MSEDRNRQVLGIEPLLDIMGQVGPSSLFYERAAHVLETHLVMGGDLPERRRAVPDGSDAPPLLTIGMATYDDFDGAYFSIQAIRLYHPEIADRIEILVIDNNPGGICAQPLRSLETSIKNCRYVPAKYPQGTCARDLVFREARGDFVLCMDSHVFFAPGSLKQLIDYLLRHPHSNDLLQGPMLYDDLGNAATRMDPVWQAGMWGTWATGEGGDPGESPFEIPMHGLGVFACRRAAWPGLNPRLRGFGGEEGCLHQKFRQAGATTWCLPFLRWMHRFQRPQGAPYRNKWEDRIFNYLIWFDELGLDPAPVVEHFTQLLGEEATKAIVDDTRRELVNPFSFFDAIYCINLDSRPDRWETVIKRFTKLGIAQRIRRFAAIETPHNHHIGCALSHRTIVAEAKKQALRNVLVFEDDLVFSLNALEEFGNSVAELRRREWWTLYLGGARWGREYEKAPGCCYLQVPDGLTTTHAIAYNAPAYDRVLAGIPETPADVALWLRTCHGMDQYYAVSEEFKGKHLLTDPIIATQTNLLDYETRLFDEAVPDLETAEKAARKVLSARRT